MANEKRLIDANALKAEFTGNFHEMWHYTGIRAMIDVQPTIDAVEVVHSKWLRHWNNYICDSCRSYQWLKSNYCPNCGADMRERKENG